jgi:hypothetical protein
MSDADFIGQKKQPMILLINAGNAAMIMKDYAERLPLQGKALECGRPDAN